MATQAAQQQTRIDTEAVRSSFRMLERRIHEHRMVYLDSAASALKPVSMIVDKRELGCEFYAMSEHKIGGPTGVGVLYGRREWLERLPPYQVGGVMARSVSPTDHEWKPLPKKFDAGAEAIAEIVAFSASLQYWQKVGLENIEAVERELVQDATERLQSMPGINILGANTKRVSIAKESLFEVSAEGAHTDADSSPAGRRTRVVHVLQHLRRMRPPGRRVRRIENA